MSTLYITGGTTVSANTTNDVARQTTGLNNVVTDAGHTFSSTNGFTVPAGTYLIRTTTKWSSASSTTLKSQGAYDGTNFIIHGAQWPSYRATDTSIVLTSCFVVTVSSSTTFGPAFHVDVSSQVLASGNNTTFTIIELEEELPVNDADTVAGSDSATANIAGTQTDTASGADAATGKLAGTYPDTAAGSEAVSSVKVSPAADTATGSEAASVRIVASADTGTGTDVATGNLVGVQADTATGTESATGNLAGVRTDTGTGSEAVNLVNLTGVGDTATGVEGQSVNQGGNTFLVSDDATVSDAGRISTAVGDTGTAADSAFATNLVVGTDTATGSESAALRVATPADTGTGTEAATGKLAGTQADTATGTDAASVRQSVSDTSTGADVGSVGISPADTATVSESATVTIIVIKEVTDTAVATEAITKLSVLAAEISVADENGFVAGLLLGGDRVKGVGAEDRTFYVLAEPRTLAVEPQLQPALYITDEPERVVEIENENRLKMIGREDRTLTIYAPVREEMVV